MDDQGIYRRSPFTSPGDLPGCVAPALADLRALEELVPRAHSAADLVRVLVRTLPAIMALEGTVIGSATWIEEHDLDLRVVHPHVGERFEDQPDAIAECLEMIRSLADDLTAVIETHRDMGGLLLSLEDLPPIGNDV